MFSFGTFHTHLKLIFRHLFFFNNLNHFWTKINMNKNLRNDCLNLLKTYCLFCQKEEEYAAHLFLQCEFSYQLWIKVFGWLGVSIYGADYWGAQSLFAARFRHLATLACNMLVSMASKKRARLSFGMWNQI